MQNYPKPEYHDAPPVYSPGVYNIEPESNTFQIRNKDIKSLYVMFVIAKCLYDVPKFWAFYQTGMSSFYMPTVFDFFADLVLLETAILPQVRDLKYIEVFSHIFLNYYLFVTCVIPIVLFLFNDNVKKMFGSRYYEPIAISPFVFYHLDLTLVQSPRDLHWFVIFMETELKYVASAIVASMLVYLSKHLAEHLIVQKRRAGRVTNV